MMLIFFSTSMMMGILLLFLSHPLSFGFSLLIQTIIITLITGVMNYNYWFSYIIFLIMIGGMLILFMYMTSVASNEKFKFSYKLFMMTIVINMITMMSIMIDHYFFNLILNNSLINKNNMINFTFIMNKFLTWPMNLNFYVIIIYLLISLIMVVKITDIKSGPLRQKF